MTGGAALFLAWTALTGAAGQADPLPAPDLQGSRNALDRVLEVLHRAGVTLEARTEGLLDRRLRSLAAGGEAGPELRRRMAEGQRAAGLDLLLLVRSPAGSSLAEVVAPTEDLAVRARVEESSEARALAGALAAPALRRPSGPPGRSRGEGERSGGRAPPAGGPALRFFAALPAVLLSSAEPASSHRPRSDEPVLALVVAVPAGSGAALLGGARLSSLDPAFREALTVKYGQDGPRWSGFLRGGAPGWRGEKASGPSDLSGPPPRIVCGEGIGKSLPRAIVAALVELDRTSWPRLGDGAAAAEPGTVRGARPGGSRSSGRPPAARSPAARGPWSRGEWRALRDAEGALVGGIGVLWPRSPASGATPRDHGGPPGETDLLLPVGTVAVLGLLALLGVRVSRRVLNARRTRHRSLDLVASEIQAAGERTGQALAGSIGLRLLQTVERRLLKQEIEARQRRTPPPPPSAPEPVDPCAGLAGALLATGFPLALCAVDSKQEITFWNPAAERLLGGRPGERRGQPLDKVALFGQETEVRDRVLRVLQRRAVEPPLSFSFDRERVYHVLLTVLPLPSPARTGRAEAPRARAGPAPAIEGALLVAEDVTQRMESELAVRVLSDYQKALSASLPIPLVVVDAQERVVSWNRAMEALRGLSERAALGKVISELALDGLPRAAFPLCPPGGGARGTLYLFGELGAVPAAPGGAQTGAPAGALTGGPAGVLAGAPEGLSGAPLER